MSKRQHKEIVVDDPVREFRDAVRDVQPLPDRGRVVHAPIPVAPQPRQRQEDDRQVLVDSLSDQVEPDLELESGEELAYVRPGLPRQLLRRLRGGQWATQGRLDLHGSRTEEARALLVEFLAHAARHGHRCVVIVHGKGLRSQGEPVLKRKVAGWLIRRNDVLAFCQTRPADGGSGAVAVLLKGTPADGAARTETEDE